MSEPSVLIDIDRRGQAEIILNRPERHNAFDDRLVAELTAVLRRIEADSQVRVVLLRGAGKSFCAGADLEAMLHSADAGHDENLAAAREMAELMRVLHEFDKPTVVLAHGAVFGGGIGLVSCCDIALAAVDALFCFSEVKLGLIPAVISPYVIAAIGGRAARRYFLSAERFDAEEARRIGLVHEAVEPGALLEQGQKLIAMLLENGPQALAAAKRLIATVECAPMGKGLIDETALRIAGIRDTDEAREGIRAFLEKRKPSWRTGM